MNAVFDFQNKSSLLWILVFTMLILTGCSIDFYPQRPTALPTAGSPATLTSLPTQHLVATIDTSVNTPTLAPGKAPLTATMTPTPPDIGLSILPIESEWSRCVEWTSWSDDDRLVYYSLAPGCGQKPLRWAAYDIANHSTTIISSPIKYDPGVWQRLNVPNLADSVEYPELRGYMSPSGSHVIYTVVYGNPGPGGPGDPSARTEIWIADSNGRYKTKLLTMLIGIIHQAVWLEHETQVIFDFGYEGYVGLHLADVRTGKVLPLPDVPVLKQGTDEKWTVSPDGTTLAIIDPSYQLWLVSLREGKARAIEKSTRYPYWSKDSKSLYYWWGPSYRDAGTLRAYDVVHGSTSTLVAQSSFARVLDVPSSVLSDFAVSSSGDKVLLWGDRLWLVELRK